MKETSLPVTAAENHGNKEVGETQKPPAADGGTDNEKKYPIGMPALQSEAAIHLLLE